MKKTSCPWLPLKTAMALAIGILSTGDAQAQTRRALLIGATTYSEDIKDFVPSLSGPRNDVTLLYRTLTRAWGEGEGGEIRVLADTLDKAAYDWPVETVGRPTRLEILDELARLEGVSVRGDEVMIYFSGHGAQIPERVAGSEQDGLDEIFLPVDFTVSRSPDGTLTIGNHIIDDEIGAAVDALVGKGVFVWLVVDSCHSGTIERSAEIAARPRNPSNLFGRATRVIDLNVPDGDVLILPTAQIPAARAPAIEVTQRHDGGFAGFYAAQPSEVAWERPLPRDAPKASQNTHGMLTWNLVRAIEAQEGANYEELARAISVAFWQWGNSASRPMFAGDLRRPPMIEAGNARTWSMATRNRTLFLKGGQVDGIDTGAVVVVTQGGIPDAGPLFYARVTESALEEARIEIIIGDHSRPSRLDATMSREGFSLTPDHRWRWLEDRAASLRAGVVERPIPFVLKVARPEAGTDAILESQRRLVDDLLLQIAATDPDTLPIALEVVDAGSAADVRLVIREGRLWFVPDLGAVVTQGGRQAFSLAIEGLALEKLLATLRQIGKASNLLRILGDFSGTETAQALDVTIHVEERAADPTTGGCPVHPAEEPRVVPAAARPVSGFQARPDASVRVGHCDRVYLELRNVGSKPLDVSPLYFSPWSEVYFIRGYRDARYFGLRVEPGQTRIISYTESTAPSHNGVTPVGDMRLVLIASEAHPGFPYAADFRHLEGNLPGDAMRAAGAPESLREVLNQASFGGGSVRSGETSADTGRAGAVIIPIETLAPDED